MKGKLNKKDIVFIAVMVVLLVLELNAFAIATVLSKGQYVDVIGVVVYDEDECAQVLPVPSGYVKNRNTGKIYHCTEHGKVEVKLADEEYLVITDDYVAAPIQNGKSVFEEVAVDG